MQDVNVVKIGSDSVNENNVMKLLDDIKRYEQETWESFVIISSWAVALWRQELEKRWKDPSNFSSAALSAIGQQFLMQMYDKISWKDTIVGQILLDDYINWQYLSQIWERMWDFGEINSKVKKMLLKLYRFVNKDKDSHLVQTMAGMIKNKVLVIINHNDATSSEELKNMSSKVDNDKNTVHISKVVADYGNEIWIRVKRVIILTSTAWLLDINGNTVLWWEVNIDDLGKYLSYVNIQKNASWTGGMWSKVESSFKVLKYWVEESIITAANTGLDCLSDKNISTHFFLEG